MNAPNDPNAPDIILKLSNIESYYGPIMAIRGISLEVPRGRIVTLLGANGAGKTTVLKTISGILDPQKGTIEFLGKPIQRMEADKIVRLGLSHVPEGREVFPFLSVRENLMMGAYPRRDREASPTIWSGSTDIFRGCASGSTSRPGSSRAASSRCSRSGAR